MSDPKPLTPPDRERCQCEITETPSPFTMGGDLRKKTSRCPNKPTRLITEKKPGPDGQIGAMTACDTCFDVFAKQMAGVGSGLNEFFIEKLP